MASIADMLIQTTAQSNTQGANNLAQAIQVGSQLAQGIQNVQMQRERIEQEKQQNQLARVNKVMEAFEKGANFKDKAAQNLYFKNYLPSMVKALKVDDVFTPESMQFIQGSDEVRQKVLGLRLDIQDQINRGKLKGAAILDYARSKLTPEELATLDTDSLVEQQKFAASEEGKSFRVAEQAKAALGKQVQAQDVAPAVEYKKKVADDARKFNAEGGQAAAESKLKKVRNVIKLMQDGKLKTGSLAKALPGTGGNRGQAILDPLFKKAQDDIKSAINIKSQLDSQFSDKAMIETQSQLGLDGALPTELNLEKMQDLEKQLSSDLRGKVTEFKKLGLVQDSASSVDIPDAKREQFKKLTPAAQAVVIQQLTKKFDVPIEDIKKALGVK